MSDSSRPDIFQPETKTKPVEKKRSLHHADILPKGIKNKHVDGFIIETVPVAADKEDGTKHQKAVFGEDDNKLYIYNNTSEAWVSVTLS